MRTSRGLVFVCGGRSGASIAIVFVPLSKRVGWILAGEGKHLASNLVYCDPSIPRFLFVQLVSTLGGLKKRHIDCF